MRYTTLGQTDLKISRVCLGTMTWGEQNTQDDAFGQMDYALERGVNFWDTAELYSIPIHAETYGATETMIGNWFAATGKREQVVLATKIAGPGPAWIRGGGPLTGDGVRQAIDGSLKRLQTDYVDLYQLHWPNRDFPHFGRSYASSIDFTSTTTEAEEETFLDILRALDDCVKAGKVRYTGLSDDSAWGIMKYLELAEKHDLPRMQSIQNEFSLLRRSDDPYVAEVCAREGVSYLPWSPLAAGILSGKYKNGAPKGSRGDVEQKLGLRSGLWRLQADGVPRAVDAYVGVADRHGLDVCQMALKFCDMQSFVSATIIGATSMEQLKTDIDAFDLTLSDDVLADIDKVYRQYPLLF